MNTTSDILVSLKNGKPRRVRGQLVTKEGESFIVDGDSLNLVDAVSRLDQAAAPRGFDYSATIFFEQPPFSSRVVAQHRCLTKAEHAILVSEVKKRKNYLYYGTAKKDENRYIAIPPFVLDWDTVPEHPADAAKAIIPPDPARWSGGLSCPFCDTEVSSTAGRTLHVKAVHSERVEEYSVLLAKVSDRPIQHDDVVDLINDKFGCPYCNHKINSTSGRTLHVKSKHPDKFAEYVGVKSAASK